MPVIVKTVKAAASTRALAVKKDTLNKEARTVDAIFASETPIRSWMPEIGEYDEILSCNDKHCDMSRLLNGAQFLKEHNRNLVVGVVENARFENGLGIATLRYAKTPLGEEEFAMMEDGIRRNFSVSFAINELVLEKTSEEDGDTFRATGWEPNEISVVSVEADTNCKALRSRASDAQPVHIKSESNLMKRRNQIFHEGDNGGASGGTTTAPALDEAKARAEIRAAMLKTTKDINDTAASFKRAGRDVGALAIKAIEEGWDVDKFRAMAIDTLNQQAAAASVTPNIEVIGERTAPLSKSIGRMFAGSEAYKSQQSQRKRNFSVEIPNVSHFRATATTGTITNYNGIVQLPEPIQLGVQQATVADLLAQGVTGLNAIPYLQEDTLTNAATTVAEGSEKPEVTWDWSQQSAAVKKIAVVTKVSDELFADVPGIESYVDSRLRYMVEITEDAQILTGDGIGSNITGILNTVGIQTQAVGADTKLDAIRKAMTKVSSIGFFQPDGIVLHPNDYEELALMKDANGQYLAGGPFYVPYGNGQYIALNRVWGLPAVITTSMTEGTAIVGAWKLGAMLFRRMGINIDSTNSNEDDFLKNLVALRAEERIALPVWRPKAFAAITGL